MSGDLLDLILLVLVAAFAVSGYRQGFIIGVLSFAGFIIGAVAGLIFAPGIARSLVSNLPQQALIAIVVVIVAAMIGQLIASAIGAAVRSRVTWRPVTYLDAIGGAVVSVVSILLIAWMIGSAVANTQFTAAAGQVRHSAVLRAVDSVMPPSAQTMFSQFRRLLASGPYPQVFGGLGAEAPLTVEKPDGQVVHSASLQRDEASIVKVVGTAPSCGRRIEGSGFVISPDHVLTNAHVVAGVTDGPNVYTTGGATLPATVVLFDPRTDIAVLYVPNLDLAPLRFAGPASTGANAIVAGYPLDHPFTAVAARIGGVQRATAPDIYQQAGLVTRQIYALRALIQPGNSGGPLIDPSTGDIYGVVFAAAVGVPDVGYALTAVEVSGDAQAGANYTAPVSTDGCA
ncbi:MAG TPA: MarP family serine protease [Streptosporangiaceae bacterium]